MNGNLYIKYQKSIADCPENHIFLYNSISHKVILLKKKIVENWLDLMYLSITLLIGYFVALGSVTMELCKGLT